MGYEVGQRVADYEVVSILGTGGMGTVYQVCNVISQRTEAMKVLFADLSAEPDLVSRFRGEIRTLGGLDHPNIAQLHTALQSGNELLMIMEFVEGCTLHQLAHEGPMPPAQVIDYMQQVLAALSYAHASGVVHRDIKPANIMVTPQGMVKLTDFGIAKSKCKDELTRPGTTLGSLNYMSPEQALGNSAADGRSDIYSVGITLYELLVGRRPFDDESAYIVLHRQLNVAPQPPVEINPLLSKALSDLILKALEKDPAARFQTAAEFSDALRDVTGVAGAAPSESSAVFGGVMGPGPVLIPHEVVVALPDSLPHSVGRLRWSLAVAALAVIALVVSTALGLPHFLKSGAVAKTVGAPITQPSSFPKSQEDVADTGTEQNVATTPPAPTAVQVTGTAPAPAVAFAPKENPVVAAAPLHARPAAPKLSRADYRAASPLKALSKQDEDASSTDTSMSNSEGGISKTQAEAPAVSSAATVAEVQEIRRQKDALDARAGVVRAKVTHLRTQKAAEGLILSEDMADAYVDMNVSLSAEKADMESGNVAAARGHLEKAAYEVSTLEKLFNQ